MSFDEQLRDLWQTKVDNKYLFRGMSRKDLSDPMDPSFDPFLEVRSRIYDLCDVLIGTVEKGFEFTVVAEHFGETFRQPLDRICLWTQRDLDDPGVDFISQLGSARGYADSVQGCQLKDNFKYITDELPAHRADPILRDSMTQESWSLLSEIGAWVSYEDPEHEPIVLWVRRSSQCFDDHAGASPVGTFESFRGNMIEALEERHLPHTIESVRGLVPSDDQEFCVRLRSLLPLNEIEKIETQKA